MKYLVFGLLIIGLIVLFFFPEPETNFIAYVLTGLFFIILIIITIIWQRKNKMSKT